MRNSGLLTTAAFCTVMLSSGARAAVPLTGSSLATILSGSVAIGSSTAVIPPQAAAAGKGPLAYAVRKSLPTYSATLALPDGTSLSVTTGALLDLVSSAGVLGGAITTKAGTSMVSPVFKLSNPFAAGSVTVTASKITSMAAFTTRTTGTPSAAGTATITAGSVDLSLFGLGIQTYSGTPTPNMVLFKSKDGTVTIYGNRHLVFHAAGSTVPTSLSVIAIDVHLAGAKVLGQTVNGDLAVGTSAAR
jgi:hypothetical protein